MRYEGYVSRGYICRAGPRGVTVTYLRADRAGGSVLEGTYVGQDRGGSPSPTCERIEQGVVF